VKQVVPVWMLTRIKCYVTWHISISSEIVIRAKRLSKFSKY